MYREFPNLKKNLVCALLILLAGLIMITWFKGDFLIYFGDMDFPVSPGYALEQHFHIWKDRNAGTVDSRTLSLLPYDSLILFLSSTSSLVIAQKIIFYILISLAGLSMFCLASALVEGSEKHFAALVAALFYMFNPYTLFFTWRTFLPWMFLYSSLPLTLLVFMRGLKRGSLRYTLYFGLLSIVIVPSGTNPVWIVVYWVILLSYLLFFMVLNVKDSHEIVFAVKYGFAAVMVYILLNCLWLFPQLFFARTQIEAASYASNMDALELWSSNTSFSNIFRLLGVWTLYSTFKGDPYYPWAQVYQMPLFIVIGFLIPILAFSAVLWRRNRESAMFFALISLIGLFLVKGVHPPFGTVYRWFFQNVPLFIGFRMPYEKFGIILSLSYSFLFGIGISKIHEIIESRIRFKIFHAPKLVSVAVLSLVFVVYLFPFWTGDIVRPATQIIPSSHVRIPAYYNEAKNWIEKQNDDFVILSFPETIWGATAFNWEYGYYGADPTANLIYKPFITEGASNPVSILIYDSVRGNMHFQNLGKILQLLNVKYLLLHGDINTKYLDVQSPAQIQSFLLNHSEIRLEKVFGQLYFYGNDDWKQLHVYPTPNIILVNGSMYEMFQVVASNNLMVGKSVLFLLSDLDQDQKQFVETFSNVVSIGKRIINMPVYDGTENPFNWLCLSNDSYASRYYTGWKSVIRTDGMEKEDTLSFSSLSETPYEFPSFNPSGWSALNSTLIYTKTGSKPLRIDKISENEETVRDIIGIWWETGWMGMSTKDITYPMVIPPNQKAIIQINHQAKEKIALHSLNLTSLSNLPEFDNNFPDVTFQKINPTKYIVHIKTSKSFFLVFSESYHKDWVAYTEGQQIAREYHFIANGYANAWYINKTGIYTVTLEFWPQRLFYIGSAISISTFFACLTYLTYNWVKNKAVWKRIGTTLRRCRNRVHKAYDVLVRTK